MKIKLKYGEYDCRIVKAEYTNNRTALVLIEKATGENVLTATVNIPEMVLIPGTVFIKNWSENEGVMEALIENGVLEDTGETVYTGFVEANICKLLPESRWSK